MKSPPIIPLPAEPIAGDWEPPETLLELLQHVSDFIANPWREGHPASANDIPYVAEVATRQLEALLRRKTNTGFTRQESAINYWQCLGLHRGHAAILINAEIYTVYELAAHTEAELFRRPGVGRKMLKEVKHMLLRVGTALGSQRPERQPAAAKEGYSRFDFTAEGLGATCTTTVEARTLDQAIHIAEHEPWTLRHPDNRGKTIMVIQIAASGKEIVYGEEDLYPTYKTISGDEE